jgi:hypothetical protein
MACISQCLLALWKGVALLVWDRLCRTTEVLPLGPEPHGRPELRPQNPRGQPSDERKGGSGPSGHTFDLRSAGRRTIG